MNKIVEIYQNRQYLLGFSLYFLSVFNDKMKQVALDITEYSVIIVGLMHAYRHPPDLER